jgi:hypothetical protein
VSSGRGWEAGCPGGRGGADLFWAGQAAAAGGAAGGFEEAGPFALAVPALGQVEGDAVPAVAGGAGGDGDQVAADGGGAGPGVAAPGEGAGGAQQVVRDGSDGEPGCVGVELPRRQVRQRPVVEVGQKLLDAAGDGAAVARSGGSDYAAKVLNGGRSDGETVFAGHGEYRWGSGDVEVPAGTTAKVYSELGSKLSQSDGLAIEQGGGPEPVNVYGPGDTMPNYTLRSPDGLTVMSNSITKESRTLLSDMLGENMGVPLAACTNYGG